MCFCYEFKLPASASVRKASEAAAIRGLATRGEERRGEERRGEERRGRERERKGEGGERRGEERRGEERRDVRLLCIFLEGITAFGFVGPIRFSVFVLTLFNVLEVTPARGSGVAPRRSQRPLGKGKETPTVTLMLLMLAYCDRARAREECGASLF